MNDTQQAVLQVSRECSSRVTVTLRHNKPFAAVP